DSGVAIADQLDPELGFVGRVTSSDPALLTTLTTAGYMPVVACVAGGANGQVYNVNGESMAVAVASAWKADRLVFLTDVPGVLDASKTAASSSPIAWQPAACRPSWMPPPLPSHTASPKSASCAGRIPIS